MLSGPSPLFADPADELGDGSLLFRPFAVVLPRPLGIAALILLLMAPSAESAMDVGAIDDSAVDDDVRERLVATPLTSLSASSVGSRETNSFCSNWTTTYGRALDERTFRPRADMSLTCICPFDGPLVPLDVADEDVEATDGAIEPFADDEVEADAD